MNINNCKICGIFQQNGWVTENTVKSPERDNFPDNLDQMTVIKQNNGINRYALYQCPGCGTYYLKTMKDEFDNYDEVMVTVEKLYSITDEKARKIINPAPGDPHFTDINITQHCSKCSSGNVKKLRDVKVGEDYLVWYKCLDCGNEEFMDSYQLDDY
jgi:hypothetical protein